MAPDAACVADGVELGGLSVAGEAGVEFLPQGAHGERALVRVVGHLLTGLFFERLLVFEVLHEGRH